MDLSQFTIKGLLVQQIRDEIICGNFEPGMRLRLRNLADQFNVSTQPIREALSELEAEGLVQTEPRKGAIVTALSPEELIDLFEIRATLESMATRLAVPHINAEVLEVLNGLIRDMDGHMGKVVELVQLNKRFHLTLYTLSGRKHLCNIINSLRSSTSHYLHAYMHGLDGMPLAQDEHRAIVKACAEKDEAEAAVLVYRHVMQAGEGIIEYINQKDKDSG